MRWFHLKRKGDCIPLKHLLLLLLSTIEKTHPALYSFTDKEEFDP